MRKLSCSACAFVCVFRFVTPFVFSAVSLLTLVSLWSPRRLQRRGNSSAAPLFALPPCCCCCCCRFLSCFFLFPPPAERLIDVQEPTRQPPADRGCLRYIARVMANTQFAPRQPHTLSRCLNGKQLRAAAENWPRFSLAPLDFNCWSRLSYQLHLFSVKMFFMSAVFLSVLPALRQSSYHLFFSQVFFFLLVIVVVLVVVCAFIPHLSARLFFHSFISPYCIIVFWWGVFFCNNRIYDRQSPLSLYTSG